MKEEEEKVEVVETVEEVEEVKEGPAEVEQKKLESVKAMKP